jgi:SAM-dependent methyltransferase
VTDPRIAYGTVESAELYDVVHACRGDLAFWQAIVARAGGGPVLEIGCGTGRVALALARAGHEVVGLDASSHMIEVARGKLRREPRELRDRVRLLIADMTSFDLGRGVAAIASPFGSFQHLRTVAQQLACLECCRGHLPPGGRLILDLFNPDPVPASLLAGADVPVPGASVEGEGSVIEAEWTGGRRIRSWMTVIAHRRAEQISECEVVYEIVAADGASRRLTESFSLRHLFRYELEHLLARAGFDLVELYGDYDLSSFRDGSLGMIAVAARG